MQANAYTKGKYAGTNTQEADLGGVLLSETLYEKNTESDWHYHENPYFAFILNGGSAEVRKTERLECLPGQAYFYNWQDQHRNEHYAQASRNFNVEFDKAWLTEAGFDMEKANGAHSLKDPQLKLLLVKLFKEYKTNDGSSELSAQALALQLVSLLNKEGIGKKVPAWAKQIKEILDDRWAENLSLKQLADVVGIHPVNIARYFPKYVHCSFGEYVRRIRIERSLPLVRSSNLSLTQIAYHCGFADQSHFIRTFKQMTHFLPNDLRKG